jgi:hypothetical protein
LYFFRRSISKAGFVMAIFHLSAKTVSRGKGQSAIAKAAYNAREKLRDERTGELKDYSRAAGVVFSAIFAPKDCPAWARDRSKLWNEVERAEKRKDAQLAREITLGLPHELTADQRRQLVTDFVREQFVRKGMIADVNIHTPGGKGDDRNHHAHILLTMREINPNGFGPKAREWNSREQIEKWREGWERTQNRYLERHGHDARVDRRTLEAQGIDREPTTHLGPHASAMEQQKGIETERGKIHRGAHTAEQETAKLKRELAAVERQISALEHGATVIRAPRETRAAQSRPKPAPTRFPEAARETTARRQSARRPANDNIRPAVVMGKVAKAGGAVFHRGLGAAVKVAEAGLEALGSAIESLFAPPAPKTSAQIDEDRKRQASAANDAASAWERYARTEDYERHEAREREASEQRHRGSEDWRKRQERERER